MTIRFYILILLMALVAACQPAPQTAQSPTIQPFPTMTVGQVVRGELGTPGLRPDFNVLPNPATAVALANRPTATPNRGLCPTIREAGELGDFPSSRDAAINAMLTFLNEGGEPERLQQRIISEWEAFGEAGFFRDDVDLTGEGEGELIIGYIAPGDVGTLLILGCEVGRYVLRYEAIADGNTPPELVWVDDLNNSPQDEIVLASRICLDAEFCEFQTQILTWDAASGRFVSLLDETILTLEMPSVRDIDNDQVNEIVFALDSNGNSATGPLRTGVNVYDWNGSNYRLSYFELDPPRYHIQVVQEGDKFFSRLEMFDAVSLYELALDEDENFGYWFNDGATTVDSYALYRLVLAYSYNSQGLQISNTLARINERFPLEEGETEEDLPIYVQLTRIFADSLTITNSLRAACTEVRDFLETDDQALNLLNRYGSRSPTYTALDLCPF